MAQRTGLYTRYQQTKTFLSCFTFDCLFVHTFFSCFVFVFECFRQKRLQCCHVAGPSVHEIWFVENYLSREADSLINGANGLHFFKVSLCLLI